MRSLRIAAAWESGILPFEKVRLLTHVATGESEIHWIERARFLPARQLEAVIRASLDAPGDATDIDGSTIDRAAPASALESNSEQGPESEPEPEMESIMLRLPIPVARRWNDRRDLCSAASGENQPEWQFAEYLAADYLAGAPLPAISDDQSDCELGLAAAQGSSLARRRGSDAGASPRSGASPHPDAAPGSGASPGSEESPGSCDSIRSDASPGWDASPRSDPSPSTDPSPGNRLELIINSPLPEDAWALHERIVQLARIRTSLAAAVGKRLFRFALWAGPRRTGFSGVVEYARHALGISERQARYLVSLERRLSNAPRLRDAYRQGKLSWLQCWLLLNVSGQDASGASETAWIDYARSVTVLRLREAVDDARIREASDRPCLPPPIPGDFEHRSDECPDRQMSAHSRLAHFNARAGVTIRFSAPADVAALWHSTVHAIRFSETVPLTECEAVDRMLAGFASTWNSPEAAKMRREHATIDRDGWRCAVPACSSRRNLHVHHIAFRSAGGTDDPGNLITLCASHHLHGIHGAGSPTGSGSILIENMTIAGN